MCAFAHAYLPLIFHYQLLIPDVSQVFLIKWMFQVKHINRTTKNGIGHYVALRSSEKMDACLSQHVLPIGGLCIDETSLILGKSMTSLSTCHLELVWLWKATLLSSR